MGRNELVLRDHVWAELELRGAMLATVPFSGRAGVGGTVGTITLSRVDRDELVHVERWSSRDELAHALEAPVWDRFGHSPANRGCAARFPGRSRIAPS